MRIYSVLSSFMLCLMTGIFFSACPVRHSSYDLETNLTEYIGCQDARIGVAVIINGKDTIGIFMNESFPMLSVYKFPIAMAFGEYCRINGLTLDEPLTVTSSDLKHDTYSPMLEVYADIDTTDISARELLEYSLQKSDNNASDILLNRIGGCKYVMEYLKRIHADAISIDATEAEMYLDHDLCYSNHATPASMATLFDIFYNGFTDSISEQIKSIMETCLTGRDRLAAYLPDDAVIGHKTGTGFTLPDGRLMAINDCGHIRLSDGQSYSIAVFVAESAYDADSTAKIIAEISRETGKYLCSRKLQQHHR